MATPYRYGDDVQLVRRRALHALATGTTVALAGCSDGNGFANDTPTERSQRAPITDYTARKVRDSDGDPLFWRAEETEPSDSRERRRTQMYVTSEEDLEELTFASGSDAAAKLNALATSTDFGTASVWLRSTVVPECYDIRLMRVFRESDGFYTSFCRTPRPADVECRADARDTLGFGIRLPFPGEEVDSYGSSGSSRCHEQPWPVTPSNESTAERHDQTDSALEADTRVVADDA